MIASVPDMLDALPHYDDPTLAHAELLLSLLPALKSRRLSGDNTVCEKIDEIETAIEAAGLTEKQRRSLELVAIQGYSQTEASVIMGATQPATRKNLTKGLHKFIEAYGGIENYVD